ncbi:hypothetical protein ROA7450_03038 [Roseovarius albus]|uniref:Uncharacterized protein n=1 Tax=Roseovarius albus TaxID=1247867 RepID=A0A1X6ZR12_9RHOB|nr:hypothetical protein [Roseovarius albus]SLN58962.1 hypothetical protein ROA7450_03038 [Roseovarius albus]
MNDLNKTNTERNDVESAERREVLTSLLKYTAVVGGASTVALSASEAVAKSSASGVKYKPKCNNGFGNGDQCVPGQSGPHNNAENQGANAGNPNPNGVPNAPGNSGTNGNNGNNGNVW